MYPFIQIKICIEMCLSSHTNTSHRFSFEYTDPSKTTYFTFTYCLNPIIINYKLWIIA